MTFILASLTHKSKADALHILLSYYTTMCGRAWQCNGRVPVQLFDAKKHHLHS